VLFGSVDERLGFWQPGSDGSGEREPAKQRETFGWRIERHTVERDGSAIKREHERSRHRKRDRRRRIDGDFDDGSRDIWHRQFGLRDGGVERFRRLRWRDHVGCDDLGLR
jgi:hypothetical protein